MLVGLEGATSGDAFILNHSVKSEMLRCRQHLGYCPQFDALFPLLTVSQHLHFYAAIKGVAVDKRDNEVNFHWNQCALENN